MVIMQISECKEVKFKKRDDLEEYKKKIIDKYENIKYEVLFVHN